MMIWYFLYFIWAFTGVSIIGALVVIRYNICMTRMMNVKSDLWSGYDCNFCALGENCHHLKTELRHIEWDQVHKCMFWGRNYRRHLEPLTQCALKGIYPEENDCPIFWNSYKNIYPLLQEKQRRQVLANLTGWNQPQVMFTHELECLGFNVWVFDSKNNSTNAGAEEYLEAIKAQEIAEQMGL
jgi:hypothetical protein